MISIMCVVLILVLFMNYKFKKTNYYKTLTREYAKFMDGIPNKLKYVNFGTSYARYAFDWKNEGFNFAIAPQTLHYDYKILKHYACKFDNNAFVFITIEPWIFCIEDFIDDEVNFKYYTFLKKKDILSYSFVQKIRRDLFPVFWDRNAWRYIFKDIENADMDRFSYMSKEDVKICAKKNMEDWSREFGIEYGDYVNVPPEIRYNFERTRQILTEMICYCYEHEFFPVLIMMPMSKEQKREFSQDFLNNFYYNNIKQIYLNVPVPILDFYNNTEYDDRHLYFDAGCLNDVGKKKFMDDLFYYIQREKEEK